MLIAGVGCSWTWAMPQAGAIKELPREKVGLASGTVLTVMVMGGNTAIVIIAMIIDLYPKTKILNLHILTRYGFLNNFLCS